MVMFLILAFSTKFLLAATLFVGSLIGHAVISALLLALLVGALLVVAVLCSIASAMVRC